MSCHYFYILVILLNIELEFELVYAHNENLFPVLNSKNSKTISNGWIVEIWYENNDSSIP